MNMLDAIILGATQGITEFIPVSSSGHLLIMQKILGLTANRYFLEFINIGTFFALIIYFRKQIWQIITDVFLRHNYKYARNIIITAIPAGLVGVLLGGWIDNNSLFQNLYIVTIMMFLVGVLMIFLHKLPHASSVRSGQDLSAKRALVIGLAQVTALVPGVSRSGSTIIAGRFAGMKPAAAAEYSFLVSAPLMAGVILKAIVTKTDYLMENWQILTISNLVAFVVGVLVVGTMMNYLRTHTLAAFGWYRVVVATVFLAFLLLH